MKKVVSNSNKMKQLVVMIPPDQFSWLRHSAKNSKSKLAPFVRSIFAYIQDTNPKDMHNKLVKARLSAELDQVTKQVQAVSRRKEELEKELETINA